MMEETYEEKQRRQIQMMIDVGAESKDKWLRLMAELDGATTFKAVLKAEIFLLALVHDESLEAEAREWLVDAVNSGDYRLTIKEMADDERADG